MLVQRKNDTAVRAHFRTERFNQRDGHWYFVTREGSEEGPFDSRELAQERLSRYIQVMIAGWMPVDSPLQLVPLD